MKTLTSLLSITALVLATVGSAPQARAAYTYTISSGESLLVTSGLNVSLDNNSENVWAGGIQASETTPGSGLPNQASLTTVCLDLKGTIYVGSTYTFNLQTFSGLTGLNPTWGNPLANPQDPTVAYAAINNAAYLFNTYDSRVSTATDWAALQLAVWKALYDTSANGSIVWNTGSRFLVNSDSSGAWTEAQGFLNYTVGSSSSSLGAVPQYTGYLLSPTDTSAQELIVGVSPVPEPTTLVAGAALLLPFGLSSLKLIRRRRAA